MRTGALTLTTPPRLFGKGHLAARCRGEDGATLDLIGWRWAERAADLGGRFEVLGYPELDAFQGGPVLRLADSRPL